MASPQPVELRGVVVDIRFVNPDTGYQVFLVRTDAGAEHSVVWRGAPIDLFAAVELTGSWTVDARYGKQIVARDVVTKPPSDLESLKRYLQSKRFPGIGARLAERIVRTLGDHVWEALNGDYDLLKNVQGLNETTRQSLIEAWQSHWHEHRFKLLLKRVLLPDSLGERIRAQYGDESSRVLQEEPYRLALEVSGVGLSTADRIAHQLGVSQQSPYRAQALVVHRLAEATRAGHVYVDSAELRSLLGTESGLSAASYDDALHQLIAAGRVSVNAERVYPADLALAEQALAEEIRRLLSQPPPELPEDDDEAAPSGLTAQQAKILPLLTNHRLVLLTGGPGTGKTYTIQAAIRRFAAAKQPVHLAAPTGRAAKRLAESTRTEAHTLHRLFDLQPGSHQLTKARRKVGGGLLVIDEVSMVDLPLMLAVLEATLPETTILLSGDPDQLPSIGPGQVLADLVASHEVPTLTLSESLRQGAGSRIPRVAADILAGRSPEFDASADGDVFFIERASPPELLATVEELVTQRLPKRFHCDPVQDIQVLCPMRTGAVGVDQLNARLRSAMHPGKPSAFGFHIGEKVIQSANNYDLGVFNGEIGQVMETDKALVVDFDGRRIRFDHESLRQLQPAYAITIHKSQGSEYPFVVVIVSSHHTVMLTRPLIYTALTRARQKVVLVGQRQALRLALRQSASLARNSALTERLAGA